MSKPKRHHYLSQFYLKGFSNSDNIWVFDKDKKESRCQQIKDTAVIVNYYRTKDITGKHTAKIEEILHSVEEVAKPIIDKINRRQPISWIEKENLSPFITFQFTRGPWFERTINEFDKQTIPVAMDFLYSDEKQVAKQIEDYEKEKKTKLDITPEEFIHMINTSKIEIKTPRERSLHLMLDMTKSLIRAISRLDWTFLYAPQKSAFITSDNPFIFLPENKETVYGLLTHGVKKIFPLSAKVCLIMNGFNNSINYKMLNCKTVRLINEELASQSIRFIIARDEALLSRIIKSSKFK